MKSGLSQQTRWKIWILGLLLISSFSCRNPNIRYIPAALVDFTIDVYGYDNDLSIGSSKIFKSGVGRYGFFGVLVYRVNAEDFVAYDLACPNDYENGGSISFDRQKFCLVDTVCCHTQFNILSGFPLTDKNPSPLCIYKVSALGSGRYRVHN